MVARMLVPEMPLFVVLLGVGLLAGCSPDPIYRLTSEAPDTTGFWQQGRHVVTHTVDSIQVAVAYDRTTSESHTFRLAFVNRSSSSVTVHPASVYGVVTERTTADRDSHYVERKRGPNASEYVLEPVLVSASDTLAARNPERVLLEIDKEQSRVENEAENDATGRAFFATLDAVSSLVSGPQSSEERTADATEETERQLDAAREEAEYRRTQARLSQKRFRWAEAALRRTTLVPGMRTSGFVVLPVDPRAHRLVLHVPVGPETVVVAYRQKRHDPTS